MLASREIRRAWVLVLTWERDRVQSRKRKVSWRATASARDSLLLPCMAKYIQSPVSVAFVMHEDCMVSYRYMHANSRCLAASLCQETECAFTAVLLHSWDIVHVFGHSVERPWNETLSAKIAEVQESFKNIPSMLYFSPSSVSVDGIGVYSAEPLPKGTPNHHKHVIIVFSLILSTIIDKWLLHVVFAVTTVVYIKIIDCLVLFVLLIG